jgi:hypothetical protein
MTTTKLEEKPGVLTFGWPYLRSQPHLAVLPMPNRMFTMAYSLKADPAAIARFDKTGASAFAGEQFRQLLDLYMKK